MEQKYWLGRKRASVANARRATSSEARLVHLDLAGRYSVKAAVAAAASPREQTALPLGLSPPEVADAAYYARLEIGARWLASQSGSESERQEHLEMARRFSRQSRTAAHHERS
jgi:hypothetical protein